MAFRTLVINGVASQMSVSTSRDVAYIGATNGYTLRSYGCSPLAALEGLGIARAASANSVIAPYGAPDRTSGWAGAGVIHNFGAAPTICRIRSSAGSTSASGTGSYDTIDSQEDDCRPYFIYSYGDHTNSSVLTKALTINNVTKTTISPEIYNASIYRYSEKTTCTISNGTGTIYLSRWGDIVTMWFKGVVVSSGFANSTSSPWTTIAIVPSGWRPVYDTCVQIMQRGGAHFRRCKVTTNGYIQIETYVDTTLSNFNDMYGCGIWKYKTETDNTTRTILRIYDVEELIPTSSVHRCISTTILVGRAGAYADTCYLEKIGTLVFCTCTHARTANANVNNRAISATGAIPVEFRPTRNGGSYTAYSFGAGQVARSPITSDSWKVSVTADGTVMHQGIAQASDLSFCGYWEHS